MKRISFNARFINPAGDGLFPGKIHTIRQNFDFWKKYEGQEVALYTWEGKAYRSKQKVFCVKRIVSIQEVHAYKDNGIIWFCIDGVFENYARLAENDGFINSDGLTDTGAFSDWFSTYKLAKMAILHFSDFRY